MKILTPCSWLQLSQSFKSHHVKLPQPEGPCQPLHTKALGHYGSVPGLSTVDGLPWAQHLTSSLCLTPGNALYYLSHAHLIHSILPCYLKYHQIPLFERDLAYHYPLEFHTHCLCTSYISSRDKTLCNLLVPCRWLKKPNKSKLLGIHHLPLSSWKQ